MLYFPSHTARVAYWRARLKAEVPIFSKYLVLIVFTEDIRGGGGGISPYTQLSPLWSSGSGLRIRILGLRRFKYRSRWPLRWKDSYFSLATPDKYWVGNLNYYYFPFLSATDKRKLIQDDDAYSKMIESSQV